NCRRPSNRSSRLTLPWGPSNSYAFSTAIHGIRRRSAARASRARIRVFSFTSICWRAASQASGDTIGGVFIPRCPLWSCMSLALFLSMCLSCSYSFLHCQRLVRAATVSTGPSFELCRQTSIYPRQDLFQVCKELLPPVPGAMVGLLLIRPEARLLHAQ